MMKDLPVGDAQRVALGPGAIPALRLAPALRGATRRFPGMLLQHGYGADKYDLEPIAEELAASGLVVFLPDAWGHGERFDPAGVNFMNTGTADLFIQTVQHVTDDLVALTQVIREDSAVDATRILVGGFSLGGIASILATERDETIAGLLAIAGGVAPKELIGPLGMPLRDANVGAWASDADMGHPELAARLAPRPVFLLHGEQDDRLPISGSERLYAAALPAYAAEPERLRFSRYPAMHTITPAMLSDMRTWITTWFPLAYEP